MLEMGHVSTVGAINNLDLLYADQSKLEKAEQMYRHASTGQDISFEMKRWSLEFGLSKNCTRPSQGHTIRVHA